MKPILSPRLLRVLASLVVGAALLAVPDAQTRFMPVSEIVPGMVGIGRTVFVGDQLEEFQAHILGVLRNTVAPGRDLILARLEGGPLAHTGVMQGMSGSPVYIDGRLIGAVSYSIGTFPREPIAGITPIAEMIDAVNRQAPQSQTREFSLAWPATPDQVVSLLGRLVARAAAPLRSPLRTSDIVGAPSLADWAPRLRPIGAAMVTSGLSTNLEMQLRTAMAGKAGGPALSAADTTAITTPDRAAQAPLPTLRPGDPVGMTFMRGDLEMGATGTITHIDGAQVYAFGHPFLNQGPTAMAMTRATVLAVIPSLDSSMKIGAMGPVVGRMTQDRATAVGGVLGPGPDELEVNLRIESSGGPARLLHFNVLHDQSLTPLFTYVAILNSLGTYERQTGATSISAQGQISFDGIGTVSIDDAFTGDQAVSLAAAAIMNPIGAMAANTFGPALPRTVDLTLRVSETEDYSTIERVWLDTTRPTLGGTHILHVLLRQYRADEGATEVISLPITMPTQASGPVTLLVSDGPSLTTLEQSAVTPGPPTSLDGLLARIRNIRSSNRLYVRLLTAATGLAAGGEAQPSLPASVQAALDADTSGTTTPLTRTVVGTWDRRMPRVLRGSRELTLTLRPAVSPAGPLPRSPRPPSHP